MRALVLTTIITLTGGSLVALAACGGSETTGTDPGDASSSSSSSSSSGGGDGGGSSSGGDGGGSSSGSNGGPCSNLTQQGQNVTAEILGGGLPAGTGGTVADGTYVLTRAIGHLAFMLPSPPSIGAITIRITGTNAEAVTTINGTTDTHSGSFTTNGNSFSLTSTCSTAANGNGLQFMGTYSVGQDSGTDILSIHIQYDYNGFMVPATAQFTKQ